MGRKKDTLLLTALLACRLRGLHLQTVCLRYTTHFQL